jgi:hypothetical protein
MNLPSAIAETPQIADITSRTSSSLYCTKLGSSASVPRNLVSQMFDKASQIPHQQHNFADVNIHIGLFFGDRLFQKIWYIETCVAKLLKFD